MAKEKKFRDYSVFKNWTLIILILTSFGIWLLQTQKTFAREPAKKIEKFNFKVGGGYPFTWNSALEFTIENSGARIGAIAQGPHDPYNPEIPDAKPSITTYGLTLGWGIPKWKSKFKGTGADFFLGTGITKNDIKFHYNYGFEVRAVATLYQEKKIALGVYTSYKKMYLIINREQNGLTWKTSSSSLDNINLGITVMI